MAVSWRIAFLEQSYSDYQLFLFLHNKPNDVSLCHTYHFLQMATEKLARGFVLKPNSNDTPARTHNGFLVSVRHAGRNVKQFNHLYYHLRIKPRNIGSFFRALEPIADAIERLAPALSRDGINPEYPWKDKSGIQVPALFNGWSSSLRPLDIVKLAALLEAAYKAEGIA